MDLLESHLNSLNFATQLDVVKDLIDKAQVKMTFSGRRVVETKDFSGSVHLDLLAIRVEQAGRKRCEADDLSTKERILGIEIVKKLQSFYCISDEQFWNSNFLTKFLYRLHGYEGNIFSIRYYIEDSTEYHFRGYSESKFLQQFGGAFDELERHPASNGSFGPPGRIVAKEESIRALMH